MNLLIPFKHGPWVKCGFGPLGEIFLSGPFLRLPCLSFLCIYRNSLIFSMCTHWRYKRAPATHVINYSLRRERNINAISYLNHLYIYVYIRCMLLNVHSMYMYKCEWLWFYEVWNYQQLISMRLAFHAHYGLIDSFSNLVLLVATAQFPEALDKCVRLDFMGNFLFTL